MEWTKEKPDYACVFVGKHNNEYELWRFEWEQGEPPEDRGNDEDETRYYYLAWLTNDGDEYDDIADCKYDEYLILEKLKTMDEVHDDWVKNVKEIW